MAGYTPPPKNNIPFDFDTGGYQSPDFNDISMNFFDADLKRQMNNLKVAINVISPRDLPAETHGLVVANLPTSIISELFSQEKDFGSIIDAHLPKDLQVIINPHFHETYTFLKYCEDYIVGYSQHGVQIIRGRCHYGGIRDIEFSIDSHYPVDLPAWIGGVVEADIWAFLRGRNPTQDEQLGGIIGAHLPVDLSGWVRGVVKADLSAEIRAFQIFDLGSIIGAHLPEDLQSIIDTHLPENISAFIRGMEYRDLSASTYILYSQNFPATIGIHLPEDLSGYIKPWPEEDLLGFIHGWDTKDLGGIVRATYYENLPAIIATHRPQHIRSLIKGWVREAEYDLAASIQSFGLPVDLGAYIKARETAQLPAYLNPVPPRNLLGLIYGWQAADLGAEIDAQDYPWNLTASIVIAGGFKNLTAEVSGKEFLALPSDLSAYILVTRGRNNLPASMIIKQARDLGAFIDPGKGLDNITAEIYPKIIRLTGILSMITMEHSDMSATISIPCFYSELKDLSAYIRPVFQSNLSAYIYPKDYAFDQKNLGASFGYTLDTVVQDKLTINIYIDPLGFRTEDKYDINISVFRSGLSIGASITGQFPPANLTASINSIDVIPYDFETWKGKEKVYDTNYTQVLQDYEDVDVSFRTIVKDYFYSSGSDVVAKVDKYTHFVTKVASYYSPAKARRLDRTLHKVKYLYDMRHFESIDEAMRYAIWYVTTTPKTDMGAYINSIAPMGSDDMSARIGAKRYFSTNNNLTSYIDGKATHDYDVVIGYTDDGVDFLSF